MKKEEKGTIEGYGAWFRLSKKDIEDIKSEFLKERGILPMIEQ